MENYVAHQLTIEGIHCQSVIREFAGDTSTIDFNRIVPIPEDLKVEWSFEGFMGLTAVKGSDKITTHIWLQSLGLTSASELLPYLERERPESIELGRKYWKNMEKHGHPTWQEWCLENWGTKYNALSPTSWELTPDGAVIYFNTQSRPPGRVIHFLSERFSSTPMTLRFFDSDWSFAGEFYFADGFAGHETITPKRDDPRSLELYRIVYGTEFLPT